MKRIKTFDGEYVDVPDVPIKEGFTITNVALTHSALIKLFDAMNDFSMSLLHIEYFAPSKTKMEHAWHELNDLYKEMTGVEFRRYA